MSRISPLALALAAALAACGDRGGAWERFDLTSEAPEVLQRGRWVKPYRAGVGFLGDAEVRDLSLVNAEQLVQFPQRTSGQVRVLDQAAGSRLGWSFDLGREPLFTATPIGGDPAVSYHVLVRDSAGVETELFRQPARAPGPSAPAAIEIGLEAWSRQRITLILAITGAGARAEGGAPPRAVWGSPEVWSRGTLAAISDGPPNVLLLGMDTLRADAVGPRAGGRVSLTPALDALAAHSDVWSAAYSTFNVTNPSFASIFTGLYGKNHGVYDLATPLPPGFTTLAESYSAAGYRTLAVIAASHLGNHNSGLGQGFDRTVLASHHAAAESAVSDAMEWIDDDQAPARRPFFAWVHLFDPHTPHTPPQPYASGLRPAAAPGIVPVERWLPFRAPGARPFLQPVLAAHGDLYQGEVAYLDRQVGRLVEFLSSRGLLENTVIAVVSDHGENLGEHGIHYQHIGLFESTTHVPMMIRWPGKQPPGRRFSGLVQTLDLFPTLLGAAGLPVPEQDGVDLRELTGDGRSGRRMVFSEHFARNGARARSASHALMTAAGIPAIADGEWLFDLRSDPGETRNLSGSGATVELELRRALGAWQQARRADLEPGPGRQLDAEEIAKLRALGYF